MVILYFPLTPFPLKKMLAPIALFAYNRPLHLQKNIESLILNELAKESEIFIFSDAPPKNDQISTQKITEIRDYLQKLKEKEGTYFKKIHLIFQQENQGLAQSIITGVSQILEKFPHVIVMEDDLVCSVDFLKFMNDCLEKYAFHEHIFSISGYRFPFNMPSDFKQDAFLLPRASSWGWATWADRWQKADWEVTNFKDFWENGNQKKVFNQGGEDLSLMLYKQQKGLIHSWAIRWCFTLFRNHAFCVYPYHSKIQNTGHDNSGTNSANTAKYNTKFVQANYTLPENPIVNTNVTQRLSRFFRPSIFRKIINWWKFGYFA